MQLYLSGSIGNKGDAIFAKLIQCDGYRLCTYAYPKEAYEYLNLADGLGLRANMMIDSGAFTAWQNGKPIELEKLLSYSNDLVQRYGDRHNFVFISLDVIPGQRNRFPTPAELKAAEEESYDNYLVYQHEMKDLHVLPVYHSGEALSLRDKYLKHTDHICLSMNQGMSEKNRVEWAMSAQAPGIKLHGLAATGVQMIKYVDWYSVDSAAWIMSAAMGSIYWPLQDGRISTLPVSSNSPAKKKKNAHADNMTISQPIIDVMESRGYTLEQLGTEYLARMQWNMETWHLHKWIRTPMIQRGLFDD